MTQANDQDELAKLETKIKDLKKATNNDTRSDEHFSTANMAWRMVIELVAGLGIGFGIGYGLDTIFGTTPILMVIFIMLGLAAGIKTMIATSKEIQEDVAGSPADE